MGCKRFEKKKPSRLWTLSANQARKSLQLFKVQGTNGYNNLNKRGDDFAAMKRKCQTYSEEPSRTRVGHWPNDVARTSSSRLNNSKVSLQSDIENARPSTSRPNNVLGSRQKYTKKPMPSSLRPNNRKFSSRSNNGSVSREKYVKKPQSSSSTSNNSLVSPQEIAKKTMCSSSRVDNGGVSLKNNEISRSSPSRPKTMCSSSKPDNGGASSLKNNEISTPSPSRPNNNRNSSLKDIEKSRPSSSSPNGGSVPPPKNIEQLMFAKSRPSRLRGEFSSRRPTFIGSNGSSNSTNKSPPSLVHGHSSNVEMSTQVQSEELWKAKEASTSSLTLEGNKVMHGLEPQTAKVSCMSSNMEQNADSISLRGQLDSRKQNTALVSDGKPDDGKCKSKIAEPLLEEKFGSHVVDDSAKDNTRPKKRMRKDINEDDDDDDDDSDQNLVGAESGTAVITETAGVKDCHTEVSHHLVSESFKLIQYSSLPIDEPIWSGIIKTCSKEYVSLAAHLSTKYCDIVSKLSRSLQPVLEVTKLSRLEAWPKSFETSRPTAENIALYFFPYNMRQDAELDELVKEVVEKDMVLRAVVDEAELLIFPSVLLPEQYRTFQGKPYLWGVFRPRKEKFTIVEEEQHDIGHCAQEEMGKQHATHRGVGKKGHVVAGLNMGVGLEAPEEADGQGMEPEQTPSVARPNTQIPVEDAARATSAPTMPAAVSANDGEGAASAPTMPAAVSANGGQGATSAPTMPAVVSANDGQIHSSFSVPTGAILGFAARRTPKLELLLEELQREGAVVVVMEGEMIASGLGQAMATG